MKFGRRHAIWLAAGIALIAVLDLWRVGVLRSAATIAVAPDTTFITRPLGDDGRVDYVAALNGSCSHGVTPDNNSAVLFWTAMGPAEIAAEYRSEYFRMLRVPPLPEQGDYFVTWEKHIQKLAEASQQPAMSPEDAVGDAIARQPDQAATRPWSKLEFPELADWLAANEKPLDLVVDASKRPHRYDPMLSGDGTVLAILLPALNSMRGAVTALTARAMLRTSDAQFDLAWQDLSACHRLARLIGQGPTLIEAVVADNIEASACAGDEGLLQSTQLTAAQVATMRADLARLSPVSRFGDKIDTAERFIYLSTVQDTLGEMLITAENERMSMPWLASSGPGQFDWDQILRVGNGWYDGAVVASRLPMRAVRATAVQAITDELEERIGRNPKTGLAKSASSWLDSRQKQSEDHAYAFLSLLFPAFDHALDAEDRTAMQFELIKLACALEAYRADHGSFPDSLAELQPDYLTRVPQDLFTELPLHYERQGDGYLLYSLGVNGRDDGGNGYADQSADIEGSSSWDDLVVRIPAAVR